MRIAGEGAVGLSQDLVTEMGEVCRVRSQKHKWIGAVDDEI